MRRLFALVLALFCVSADASDNAGPRLVFEVGERPLAELSLKRLRSDLGEHRLEVYDAMYKKDKRYRALELAAVLRAGFGEMLESDAYSHLALVAKDGYASVAQIERALEPGGYLVFEDLEFPQWEPIGSRGADPAPLYVMWSGAAQLPKAGYPWPWQLVRIRLLRFEEQYPEVVPAAEDAPVQAGFELFRTRCLRCHALNGQGGKVGPDLNAPRNVLSYRSAEMVKAFIREPRSFRDSKMPNHQDLTARQLDDLVEYLWAMRRRSPDAMPVQP